MSKNEDGIKIILLGETGVGKTNLIRVFFGMEFKENFVSSSSSDCFEGDLKYNDKSYKFFLWDTAGQERYRAINRMFFKDAKIILIVYSIIDKHSFDEVDFWIKYVKENIKDEKYIIALIANKNDLYEKQIVMDEEGREAAEKYNIDFPTIYLEPGRSIISTAGVTLYTVGSSKQVPNGRKYVAIDGGMADNPRPSLYQSEYTAEIANKPQEKTQEKVTLAGRYCESGDVIVNEINLPRVNSGDIVCVYNTGAYNYSMASNYNRVQKPAMVLVNNSQSDIIIDRESLDDIVSHDIIPDRLV
mgnify:CR=1 FL=1